MAALRARASHGGTLVAESDRAVREDVVDGPPVLWFPADDVQDPALGREGPHGVAFDPDQVDVTLDDGRATVRFPNWGDADDLVDVLDVRPDGEHRYVSAARADWRRPVVEGSQMLGQVIVAAGREAPGRRVVSASMVFLRAADARAGYEIALDPITSGRTFTALGTRATQGGRTCAAGTLLLDVTAPDAIRHAEPPPDVAGPAEATPYDMGVTGRELRIVDDAYTGDADAPVGPPELDAWVRFRELPDDPPLHAGLVAQFTGHLSIAAALRPHAGVGQEQAHVSLSTAINAIQLSFHADVRADRWLLYHHRSTVAGDGMTHAECRIHEQGGALVASFTVDAMVRGFADPARGDHRSAL
jgi:acyl-CoA thioesterase